MMQVVICSSRATVIVHRTSFDVFASREGGPCRPYVKARCGKSGGYAPKCSYLTESTKHLPNEFRFLLRLYNLILWVLNDLRRS